MSDNTGLFFSVKELSVFFKYLKRLEDDLTETDRDLLNKIESFLYQHLSIEEMEKLQDFSGGVY